MKTRDEKKIVKEADTFKRRQSDAPARHEKGACDQNLEAFASVGHVENARKGETSAPCNPFHVAAPTIPEDLQQWFSFPSKEIGLHPFVDAS